MPVPLRDRQRKLMLIKAQSRQLKLPLVRIIICFSYPLFLCTSLILLFRFVHYWNVHTSFLISWQQHCKSYIYEKSHKDAMGLVSCSKVVDSTKTTTNLKVPAVSIAYVVTITECSGSPTNSHSRSNNFNNNETRNSDNHSNNDNNQQTYQPSPMTEGAAVLAHSIHRTSIHGKNNNDNTSIYNGKYNYQLYAIVTPQAVSCAQLLIPLGYRLVVRDTPIPIHDIQGTYLREHVHNNGCCGENEMIKLEAYTFDPIQHPIVVLLDLDVIILKPLDNLFDFMLHGTPLRHDEIQRHPPQSSSSSRQKQQQDGQPTDSNTVPSHDSISLLYTKDYAMVPVSRKIKPTQGGFIILRPNRTVYKDLCNIFRIGDYRDQGGWGGISKKFWGSMTVQGLIPYYYEILHPGQALELNRCAYNNMASPSRNGGIRNDAEVGVCFTLEESCEICRNRPIEQIYSTHFTVCHKPWLCMQHHKDAIEARLCRALHHEWFHIRSEMEQSWGRSGWGYGDYIDRNQSYGYCKSHGKKGYTMIQQPYGQPIIDVATKINV